MQERGCREWTRRQITKASSTVRAYGLHSGPHRITFQPRAASVRRRTVIFITPCGLKPKGADTGTRSLSSFLMILFSIRPSAPRRAAATTVARTSRRTHRDEPSPCPCDRPIVCPTTNRPRRPLRLYIRARATWRLGDFGCAASSWTGSPLALLMLAPSSPVPSLWSLFDPCRDPKFNLYFKYLEEPPSRTCRADARRVPTSRSLQAGIRSKRSQSKYRQALVLVLEMKALSKESPCETIASFLNGARS